MSEFVENKVWSPEDIVNNASSWSLAADKELLRHLHSLSEKILLNAGKTNENLVELIDDLDKTKLSLDLANIELESLHHTQFIESRVYEDDDEFETGEVEDVQVEVDKKAKEELIRIEIEEGLIAAIKAAEEYYEYKEVPNSDSDDETDSPNFMWQPKDPYLTRPLPYVIGTTEWYRKWHVGLLDDSSEDEDVNPAVKDARTIKDDFDNSGSSDDDRYLPQLDRRSTMASNSGDNSTNEWRPSDIINIDRKSIINPIANSTLVPGDAQIGETSEEGSSLPIKEPSASFAEQLAKKLGNVAQAHELAKPPEINTRPIQKAPIKTNVNMFLDEPPPLNDDSESSDGDDIFGKAGPSRGALFERSQTGLFDDLDENQSFWGQNKDISKTAKSKKSSLDVPPPVANIFDNASESEDDLFASQPTDRIATSYLPKSNTTLPLFNNEPPELPQEAKKKKPIGGVSIFGNSDIMKPGSLLKHRRQSSSDSKESTPELSVASSINKSHEVEENSNTSKKALEIIKAKPIETTANKPTLETKKSEAKININAEMPKQQNISLFDESDSLFEDDLFSNIFSKKFTSSLFDDDDSLEKNDSSSLFYASNVSTVKKKDLFSENTKDLNASAQQKSNLNIEEPEINRQNSSNNQINDIFKTSSSDIFSSDISKSLFDDKSVDISNKKVEPIKRLSLFDDETVKSDIDSLKPEPTKRTRLVNDLPSKIVENSAINQPKPPKRRNLFEDTSDIITTLPNVKSTLDISKNVTSRRRPNLFDDLDEPSTLFNDVTEKSFFDDEEIVKINENISTETEKSLKSDQNSAKETEISSIPIKIVECTEDISKKIPDDILQPEVAKTKVISEDFSSKLTHLSFLDTPPEIDDDFDTESEHNLFNDENHLLFEDDIDDLSIPVQRRSIFDDEPPLLPMEKTENERSKSPPNATPIDNVDNQSPASSIISTEFDFSPPQFNRTRLSIHDRLNSIEATPVSYTDMDDTTINDEDNKLFLDKKKEESVAKDGEKLEPQKVIIDTLDNSSRKIGAPGKIKHKLNINVAALLPGASKKAEVAQNAKSEVNDIATPNNLDELDNNTEILQCITKDRAKIPIKRRPSTRKARKEITSQIFEENVDVTENIENNNHKTIVYDNIKELPKHNEISNPNNKNAINQNLEKPPIETTQKLIQIEAKPASSGAIKKIISKKQQSLFKSSDSSSDSDDIFKTKNSQTVNIKKSSSKNESIDIFNGLKAQSLFDKQPVIKGDVFESPDYKKSKIFFDDDDDDDENVDDFFSSKKLPPKSNIMKKNLFDDEEEGDDLFQSTMFKNDMKPTKIAGPIKKSSKTTPLFPLEDTTDDPLDLFK